MTLFEGKDRAALVTGGSRGIGRAVALRLARSCAHTVIVNYLENDTEAEKTGRLVEKEGARCILAKANLAYPDEIDSLFESVKDSVGRLDIFVHCAALNAFKPVLAVKPNQWDLTLNINARSFLLCVQKCVSIMNQGKIVAVSSLGSHRSIPNYGALGPTKAALESLVRYLAFELADKGIHVNAVSAGLIETDSLEEFPEAKRLIRESIERTPAKRLGKPVEVADVVLFLVSPLSRWIYGQTIIADGGFMLT